MVASVFCAKTIVWAPVPQPKSAIFVLFERLSIKPNALMVSSGLPGPCRSSSVKNSLMRAKSNSWIVIFSIIIMLLLYI